MSATRVAVVGVGRMGACHAEKVKALERAGRAVRLAGVVDVDRVRASSIADRLETPWCTDFRSVLSAVDALVVAVPTAVHFEVAIAALGAGLHVLLEKPIAAELADAEALVAAAARGGRVLHVGHQEWWNPGLRAVCEQIEAPRYAEVHRLGGLPDREHDVDVVRDLMIHDIEILQRLCGGEPQRVEALGAPVITDAIDIANARLLFGSGCVANLTASRVATRPARQMRIVQRDAYVSIDFLAERASVTRRTRGAASARPALEREAQKSEPEDSLLLQLDAFVTEVRADPELPTGTRAVCGARAASALRTAWRVLDAMPREEPA